MSSGLEAILRALEGPSGDRISLNLTVKRREGGGFQARLCLPAGKKRGKVVKEGALGPKKCAVVPGPTKNAAVRGVLRSIANRL